jgi:hypothetical protein
VTSHEEWPYLRGALLAVAFLLTAFVVGWRVHDALHDEPTEFQLMTTCLRNEKHIGLSRTPDPVARSAGQGSFRTVIETNGVTVSVAADSDEAERIVSNYRAVGGDLGPRVEQRGRTVYLWDRPPSPTQRQTLFDCTY